MKYVRITNRTTGYVQETNVASYNLDGAKGIANVILSLIREGYASEYTWEYDLVVQFLDDTPALTFYRTLMYQVSSRID